MPPNNNQPDNIALEILKGSCGFILGVTGNLLAAWLFQLTIWQWIPEIVAFIVCGPICLYLYIYQNKSSEPILYGFIAGVLSSLLTSLIQSPLLQSGGAIVTILVATIIPMILLSLAEKLPNISSRPSLTWLRIFLMPGILRTLLAAVLSTSFFAGVIYLFSKTSIGEQTGDGFSGFSMGLLACGGILFASYLMGVIATLVSGEKKIPFAALIVGIYILVDNINASHENPSLHNDDPINFGCTIAIYVVLFLVLPIIGARTVFLLKNRDLDN